MITDAIIIDNGQVLKLVLDGGKTMRFHAIWLRDNSLDEETKSAGNGQRLITLNDIPAQTILSECTHKEDNISLVFTPENKQVTFPIDWLIAHQYDRLMMNEKGQVDDGQTLWQSTLQEQIPTAKFDDIVKNPAIKKQWLQAVHQYGFAHVSDGPTESGTLLNFVKSFGIVRETNYGTYFDVRSEINPNNLAFTGLGLQAHTDNPYRDPVPTLQVLYCLENSAQGGDSMLVDGFAAVKRLQEENSDHFDLLSQYCARFCFEGTQDVHLESRKPMIELAPDGALIAVRFNNRSAAPFIDIPFDKMDSFYDAYRHLAEIIDDPAMQISFKLNPGDSFIVDNTRVLHSRRGFSEGGSRWLQGAYADKDGLLSTLRVLEKQGY